jgi:hypothetical protein
MLDRVLKQKFTVVCIFGECKDCTRPGEHDVEIYEVRKLLEKKGCHNCNGTGQTREECFECNGSGEVNEICSVCKGEGKLPDTAGKIEVLGTEAKCKSSH